MSTEELKELIRTEPIILATLGDMEAAYGLAKVHFEALDKRRSELLLQLNQIADAKEKVRQFAREIVTRTTFEEGDTEEITIESKPIESESEDATELETGDPAATSATEAKPKVKGKKS